MVVLHHTAMQTCDAALRRLRDPASEVSSHYLIGEPGEVFALVDEENRAWHAGAGRWGGVSDVNSHSVGIEIANSGPLEGWPPYPEPQMAALVTLLGDILARHEIRAERVIAHSDMAPARKSDPGPKFDWRRLARAGLAVWPDDGSPIRPDQAAFSRCCAGIGYDLSVGDELVLAAFRLRFHPQATGPLNAGDMALAVQAERSFPVDVAFADP